MDYKITAANADTGRIEVTYSIDGTDVATYAIDVPIIDGKYITGSELEAEIQSRAPTWLLERKQAVATATGFDAIAAQVVAQPAAAPTLNITTLQSNIASTSNPAPTTTEPISVTAL